MMPSSRSDLFARLAALGIATRTIEHPPVFTVAESSMLERHLPGGHTKNLFLADAKGQLFLVTAESHSNIDLKALHRVLGCARLSFGRPALLMEVLGVAPGSVSPLALLNDPALRVTVVIDARLSGHDSVNCHPLENTATTNIAWHDLLRFIRHCGHEPRVINLSDGHTI